MFSFFRKKKDRKKEDEKKQGKDVLLESHPQRADDGLYRGMYCPVCGFMSVDPDSNALPLEGFALCANCGAPLKTGWFLRNGDGSFSLAENAEKIVSSRRKRKVSGGHYRVRPNGPYRGRFHGHFTSF